MVFIYIGKLKTSHSTSSSILPLYLSVLFSSSDLRLPAKPSQYTPLRPSTPHRPALDRVSATDRAAGWAVGCAPTPEPWRLKVRHTTETRHIEDVVVKTTRVGTDLSGFARGEANGH